MFDPRSYREACRELRAPEDKIKEIIAMTEKTNKKKMRPLRTALIAAAAVAMMVVGVSAANPEAAQEFWYTLKNAVQVDRYRTDLTTDSGEKVSVITVPEAKVEVRDGRAILVLDGKDEADISEALADTGRYEYQKDYEGSRVVVTVEGTTQDWKIKTNVGKLEEDGTYNWFGSVTTTSEDADTNLGGRIFEAGAFGEVYESVNAAENTDPAAQVTVGVTVAETDCAEP